MSETPDATLPGVSTAAAVRAASALAAALAQAGVSVHSARALPPSLEDIFIVRIRRDKAAARPEVPS